MSVFRINKNSDYTTMSNYHLKDKNLSLKAKGLLSVMLSLSDEWNYSVAGLCSISVENETAINSALKELKKYGYLVVTKNRTLEGKFEYNYDVFEKPHIEKPEVEKPPMENMGMDNNIYIDNIKEENTNNKKLNNKKEVEKETDFKLKNTDVEIVYNYYETKAKLLGYYKNKLQVKDSTLNNIKNYLKEYSVEYLKESIDRYFQVISDKDYYFDTYWKPEEFFKQKNSLPDFFEEGSKWVNYKNFKEKQKSKNPYKPNEEVSRETAYPELNDYNVL